jgi:hypothetical protein
MHPMRRPIRRALTDLANVQARDNRPAAEIRDAQTAKLEQTKDWLREVAEPVGRAGTSLDDTSSWLLVAG